MPKERDIPSELQPDAADYSFDLDHALSAVVGLRATAPNDAFTADALGTDREGSGVVIGDDGLLIEVEICAWSDAAEISHTARSRQRAAMQLLRSRIMEVARKSRR